MCEELQLKKVDSEAWGFRLTGGRDFGTPLTVLRVTGASVAEESGMEVGDMIVSINGESAQCMTHVEAQQHIVGSGNNLTLQILRGSPVPAPELSANTPLRGMTPNIIAQRCDSELTNESHEVVDQSIPFTHLHPEQDLPVTEEELTEQKIAEKMLENAELLEGNVMGVNFKRFIPKVDFIKNSLVYQVLQEEQVFKKTTEEEVLEKCPEKRFSTFLVHPNNVKPQPKKEAAKLKTRRPKTPEQKVVEPEKVAKTEITLSKEPDVKADTKPEEIAKKNESQKEIAETIRSPVLEAHESQPTVEIKLNDGPIEEEKEVKEVKCSESVQQNEENKDQNMLMPDETESLEHLTKQEIFNAQHELPPIKEVDEEVSEDSEFTKQLGLIKNQLESFRQLPSLIETQLNLFQIQIDALVDIKNKDKKVNSEPENYDHKEPEIPDSDITKSIPGIEIETHTEEIHAEELSISNTELEQTHEAGVAEHENDSTLENTLAHSDQTQTKVKTKMKRSSLFNGITPQPRPVVLPGGRIWRKPQDAYNDSFIAETLVTQAEVLIGSNTGINFRKYEPPKFAMSESAVWKMIHNLENNGDDGGAETDFYHSPIDEKNLFVAGLHMNPDVEIVVKEVEADEALKNAPLISNHHIENILVSETA